MTAKPRLVVPTGIVVLLLCARPVSAQLQASVYASGFSSPVAFVQDPSDATVHYVVEQAGLIRVIRNRVVQSTPFLSVAHLIVSGGEQGLLGLAFPPNYGASGRFYVSFTRAPDGQTVVARFKRSSNPLVADPASYFPLVWSADPDPGEVDSVPQPFIPQPFANHNGGTIAFGPDGFLYVARGDGGSANDPQNNAQNTTELLGKILRIDVNVSESHARGFVVPAGNAGLPRPEIWSIGLRNPWKFTFDDPSRGGTGAMLIGDVGQGAIEEIDYEPAGRSGRNYGWRNYEGTRSNITTPSPVSAPIFPIDADHAGPLFLGRLCHQPCVVVVVDSPALDRRGHRIGTGRAHRGAGRRGLPGQHQQLRRGRGGRALHPQLQRRFYPPPGHVGSPDDTYRLANRPLNGSRLPFRSHLTTASGLIPEEVFPRQGKIHCACDAESCERVDGAATFAPCLRMRSRARHRSTSRVTGTWSVPRFYAG
jgi:hypothetical protein